MKKPPSELQTAVSKRLRAVQAELGMTDQAMADYVGGVGRTRWGNWINENNLPAEDAMILLCDLEKLTMDWIYRGIINGLPTSRAIRLEARMQGMDPDDPNGSVLLTRAQIAALLKAARPVGVDLEDQPLAKQKNESS